MPSAVPPTPRRTASLVRNITTSLPWLAADWLVAMVAALVLVGVGAISSSGARSALRELGPTVGFLAALPLLADGCRRAGMFEALGVWMARGARQRPRRLLAMVFVAAA